MEMPLSLAEVPGACCSGLGCSISTGQRLTAVMWGRGGLAAGSWVVGVPPRRSLQLLSANKPSASSSRKLCSPEG